MENKEKFDEFKGFMEEQIGFKADKTRVDELESKFFGGVIVESLLDKLNDLVEAIFKKFADKIETKKALKLLER